MTVNAMPLVVGALCVMAIFYRYYHGFIAAKVAVLDDSRKTPAYTMYDGQNYYPTNKWVLFGHHFAAITGAGPLIGPVLAAQFGVLPGFLWILIGVVLAGAVHDFIIFFASVRHGGKSLAEIARLEGHSGAINSLALSPGGKLALSGSSDGTARIWDLDRRAELYRLEAGVGRVARVAWSPTKPQVLIAGDKGLRLWESSEIRDDP